MLTESMCKLCKDDVLVVTLYRVGKELQAFRYLARRRVESVVLGGGGVFLRHARRLVHMLTV